MRYRAFLSYSHADRDWARWLHRRLEAYRVPRNVGGTRRSGPARLAPIFRDREELPSAASLSDAVHEALGDSEWLIVLCSPHAAASRWVNEEIRAFRRLGRADRILCFIVGGEPSSPAHDGCFPHALTEPASADGEPREPVAADARPEGDGKRDALLKVVAGMLGLGFDALKRREQSRRIRRLAAATAASLIVAALTVALAITATLARNEADLRRAQAEDLIAFMLGDLREQLEEIQRLDLYQSIGDKALEYFAALDDKDASDYALAQRARNLRQIGEVRLYQGELSSALVPFEESRQIMERLVRRDTSNAENQIALANSHYYIGAVHWQRGELAQAREQFERALPLVDGVSASDPDNPSWLVERGYAYTNIGRVLELEGRLGEAREAYLTVIAVNERLVELEPESPEWALELAFAHNNIGKLVAALGRLDEAEESYRRDLAMKAQVLETNPRHNVWRAYTAVSRFFLGQLLADRGEYEEADEHLSVAMSELEDLTSIDPARIEWQSRLASVRRELGKVLLVDPGRIEQGLELIRSSIELLAPLSMTDEDDAGSRAQLVRSLVLLSCLEAGRGRAEYAADRLRTAEPHIAWLVRREPGSRDTQQLAVHADVCAARATAAGDSDSAEQSYRRALERLQRHFPATSDPRILELQAIVLAGLGRAAEAAEIEHRLRQMGYVGSLRL